MVGTFWINLGLIFEPRPQYLPALVSGFRRSFALSSDEPTCLMKQTAATCRHRRNRHNFIARICNRKHYILCCPGTCFSTLNRQDRTAISPFSLWSLHQISVTVHHDKRDDCANNVCALLRNGKDIIAFWYTGIVLSHSRMGTGRSLSA